jgi:hypothetical protein
MKSELMGSKPEQANRIEVRPHQEGEEAECIGTDAIYRQEKKGVLLQWDLPYGWRVGERYIERGTSAADVIRYEVEELRNALDVPEFFLTELDQKRVMAKDIVWVCRSEEYARRYSSDVGDMPYQEAFGPYALVLATDSEDATGYLVLYDARVLSQNSIEQFTLYRLAIDHQCSL